MVKIVMILFMTTAMLPKNHEAAPRCKARPSVWLAMLKTMIHNFNHQETHGVKSAAFKRNYMSSLLL